jgi:hypothetical protein
MEISDDKPFVRVIKGKRYSTANATLLADDVYWDGHNLDRSGRNCFLYRTENGNYFIVQLTRWVDECNSLTPIETEKEARDYFERLEDKHVKYEKAFPDFVIEEA